MNDDGPRPDEMTTGLLVCIIGLVATLPLWAVFQALMLAVERPWSDVLYALMITVGWLYLPATVGGLVQAARRWPSLADRYYALLGPPAIVVGVFAALVLLGRLVGRG